VVTDTLASRNPAAQPLENTATDPYALPPSPIRSCADAVDGASVGTTRAASTTRIVRRRKRQNVALLVLASLVGLWLGVAAPAVSPVAPPINPATASAASPQPGATATTMPVQPERVRGRGGRR
jgi:hypothetical protein